MVLGQSERETELWVGKADRAAMARVAESSPAGRHGGAGFTEDIAERLGNGPAGHPVEGLGLEGGGCCHTRRGQEPSPAYPRADEACIHGGECASAADGTAGGDDRLPDLLGVEQRRE